MAAVGVDPPSPSFAVPLESSVVDSHEGIGSVRVWGNAQKCRPRRERRRSCPLEGIVAHRNSPQKHAWRARIILSTAAGLGTVEITRRTGKSKNCVWRWQERFMQEGIAGLLRDKTRPSRIPPLGPEVSERAIALIP